MENPVPRPRGVGGSPMAQSILHLFHSVFIVMTQLHQIRVKVFDPRGWDPVLAGQEFNTFT